MDRNTTGSGLLVRSRSETFYKNYIRQDEGEIIAFNNINISIIYCPPRYRNMLETHLLTSLSPNPDPQYLMAGLQQPFVPAPGDCLV